MKILVVVFLCCSYSFTGIAQTLNETDKKHTLYGFSIGLNQTNLLLESPPSHVNISNGTGFRLGMLANHTLSKNLGFLPRTELSFNSGRIVMPDLQNDYEIMAVSLDIMTHLVIRPGQGKYRPYLLTGPALRIPLNDNKAPATYPTGMDLAIDLGVGVDKLFERWTFAPELRYSAGLRNVNRHPTLHTVHFHSMSLVFNFKGRNGI